MSIIKVNFEEAKQLIDSTPSLALLDVREEEEYITGHAINAILFTLDTINEQTANEIIPDKTKPVMVYCRSGRRSAEAAKRLHNLGYNTIYDVGGLIGWPYGLE